MKLQVLGVLCAALTLGAVAPPAFAQNQRMFLEVSVTDNGKPVPGLGANDFAVMDNGKVASNVKVEPAAPTNVVMVLDPQNGQIADLPNMARDLKAFFARNGGKLPYRVGIIINGTTGMKNSGTLTADGNKLNQFLATSDITQVSKSADTGIAGDLQRVNTSLTTIAQVMNMIGGLSGRKMLIWMGRSWPLVDAHEMTAKAEDGILAQIVEKSNVLRKDHIVLYSVDSSSVFDLDYHPARWKGFLKPQVSGRGIEIGDMALEVFATRSGGAVFNSESNLADELDHCLADYGTFYTVTFDPVPASKSLEYHSILVNTTKPGLTTRTTTGYYATK